MCMGSRQFFLTIILFCFALLCPLHFTAQTSHAEQHRTVRVGLNPISQFTRIENGQISGYIPDQLAQLARYTGWNIVYVALPDWPSSLEALSKEEIDLCAPAL